VCSEIVAAGLILPPKASWFCRPDPLAERADSGPRCPASVAALDFVADSASWPAHGPVFGLGAPALAHSALREGRSRFTAAGVEGLARSCSLCA
jgi:hypothetical protein